jgi:hypothetical protein
VRWLIATSIATVTLAPFGVRAADLPSAPPGPAVYAPPAAYRAVANWSGFYVGGNIGIGLARDRSTFSVGGVPYARASVTRPTAGSLMPPGDMRSGASRSWAPQPAPA